MDPSRRRLLVKGAKTAAGLAVLGALGAGAAFLSRRGERIEYGKEYSIIIPGTYGLDADSMKLAGSPSDFPGWIREFGIEMSFDYKQLKFGATEAQSDIWWNQSSEIKRRLIPENGVELAILQTNDFKNVSIDDLMSAQNYSNKGINGSDYNNQLQPGTVIAIKTNNGNYAKMRVDNYLPLTHKNRPEEDSKNYNLQCTLVLYAPNN